MAGVAVVPRDSAPREEQESDDFPLSVVIWMMKVIDVEELLYHLHQLQSCHNVGGSVVWKLTMSLPIPEEAI